MRFGKETLKYFHISSNKEYIMTNGLGGYASRTINDVSARRYSSLLVASLNPPVERVMLLSSIKETVLMSDSNSIDPCNVGSIELVEHKLYQTSGDEPCNQHSFEFEFYPKFSYNINGAIVTKEIVMEHGKNTTVIKYTVKTTNKPLEMHLSPMVNNRDHHHTTKKNVFKCSQHIKENGVTLSFDINDIKLNLLSDKCSYVQDESWVQDVPYKIEIERGDLTVSDYHLNPGYFSIQVDKFSTAEFTIVATIEEDITNLDGNYYIEKEVNRKKALLELLPERDELIDELALACDNFITYRKSTGLKTIMAGYPWFTDWGRDTMIAMMGLTLSTNRFHDAREILLSFSKYVKNGLIPNMFPDSGVEPMYNTIDGTMWYFTAVTKFLEYTNDYDFVKENLFDILSEIIHHHIIGTDFHIKMDADGLLSGGNKDTQLTWMDVKVNGYAVTPRYGKAVEINALWYNAICTMIHLSEKFNKDFTQLVGIKALIEKNFVKEFWCEETNYFYDYIADGVKNAQIRPNALIALSLPYSLVNEEMGKKAVGTAFEHLYTPYGMKSLSAKDVEFRGIYEGSLFQRDMTYHQGTVWSWLIGPMITATKKYLKDTDLCAQMVEPFKDHLRDGGLSGIAEIFDGSNPHNPRGCFTQAWGVSEVLRAYLEDVKRK